MAELVSLETIDGIAVLRLAADGQKIALLDEARIRELDAALTKVAAKKDVRALVIAGNSAGFCGGADISLIQAVTSAADGERFAKVGQSVFQRIEDLSLPTIAAISGACAGGGCELVLACRMRIMLGGDTSKIGLPEVKLGIIPGFGGTQRLPKLVGLPEAASLILKGRMIGGEEARRVGLVDRLVPPPSDGRDGFQELLRAAVDLAKSAPVPEKRRLPLGKFLLTNTAPGRAIVRRKLEASVGRETRGKYPAPPRAVQAMVEGLAAGKSGDGYRLEAKALGELIVSPECKSLVHVYLSSEASQKLGRAMREDALKRSAVVVGGGVMGSGIASVLLSRGYSVGVVDSSAQALQRSKERITETINGNRRLSETKRRELLGQIRFESSVQSMANAGLFIEAIIEDFDGKRRLLSEIVGAASESAIVATNTSSLSVTNLAEGLSHPERIIGMHFFNPAEKMPLVEVVRGKQTDEKSLLVVAAMASQLGKYPIIVEDEAGFLVNRLLTPYLAEAGHLLSEGYSVEEIDGVAKAFGMPMGPLRLLDEIGLDVAVHVSQIMVAAYGEDFAAPPHAERLLKAGRKGKKTGGGFYLYQADGERVDPSLVQTLALPEPKSGGREDLCDRLILRMVNEAARCLKTGIAGRPGREAADQIDLGTVMGCGFPPFRGGVIHYARTRGAAEIQKRLEDLASKYGPRFTPRSELADISSES